MVLFGDGKSHVGFHLYIQLHWGRIPLYWQVLPTQHELAIVTLAEIGDNISNNLMYRPVQERFRHSKHRGQFWQCQEMSDPAKCCRDVILHGNVFHWNIVCSKGGMH